jgi:hypothetical protein
MSSSHHHSKKGRAREVDTEAERLSAADEVAADLRRQVAILAEQVRALGTSEAAGAAAPVAAPAAEPRAAATAADLPLPPAPRPRPAASAPPQQRKRQEPEPPTEPAPQSEPEPEPAPPAARETFAERSSHLVESVVTLAELAAVEIRASAEVEAAAVRARSAEKLSASSTGHLLTLLERQRNMLAALAAQTERLEQAAAVLRAQIRALQAEREHIAEVLSDSFLAP